MCIVYGTSRSVKCKTGNPGKETNLVIGPEMKDNMAVGSYNTNMHATCGSAVVGARG